MRKLREDAGLSRDALAETLATTTRTIQRMENEGVVGSALLKRVCEILRIPVVAVLFQDAESIRQSLRANGFAPGLPPVVIDREAELAQVHAALVAELGPRCVVLSGPVGIGKTSLAQCLARDLAPDFEGGVLWVRGDFSDVRLVQLDIARALGFDAKLPVPGVTPGGRDWAQAFTAHLWQARRLVILDDVVDPAQVRAFIAGDSRATVLATTRFRHVATELGAAEVSVGPLDAPRILELLSAEVDPNLLERDRESLERLLEVIDGMPGLARAVASTLRRERLTTPASWLARLDPVRDPIVHARGPVAYYETLERQVSGAAWSLFTGLGTFGTEPAPLDVIAAAAELSYEIALAGASELLDAQLVSLFQAPSASSPTPWLRLALHPAAAARSLLGERLPLAQRRAAAHLAERFWAARRRSPADLLCSYRRHRALIVQLARSLARAHERLPDLLAAEPPTFAPDSLPAEDARAVIGLVTAVAPILMSESRDEARRWIELGLAAARGLEDPSARGLTSLLASWWRTFNIGQDAGLAYYRHAQRAFLEADRPFGAAALRTLLGAFHELPASPSRSAEAIVAEAHAEIARSGARGEARAFLLNAAARATHIFSAAPDALERAADLCAAAAAELQAEPSPPAYLIALNRFSQATYLAAARATSASPELGRAVDELCAHQPEPWVRAALRAHAAHFGVSCAAGDPEATRAEARRALITCTRECDAADAPRLLLFVTSCVFYELLRRAGGADSPLVRYGLAGHGLLAPTGNPLVPEMCGFDSLLPLSVEALSPLLDADYLALATELARHVPDSRNTLLALGALEAMLAQPTT